MASEDRQREIDLAMARGESVLLDGDGKVLTDSPAEPVREEVKTVDSIVPPKKEPVEEVETEPAEPVVPRSSLKYIPIAKYTDEKREWKTKEESYEAQLADLKAKYEAAAEDGKKFSEMEMKDYFTKFNIPQSQQAAVTEMLSIAAKQHKIPDEVTTQLSTMQEKIAAFEDEKRFDSDWNGFAGDLVKSYPNATYSQLNQAKEAMDILSHHEDKYLDKEMDYIAFREKAIFDEIFQSPVKKGFESRSQNADNSHPNEQPTKLDIDSMSPQQVLEWEARRDQEVREWEKGENYDSQGNRMI